jgi:hypothetical protein
MRTAMKLSIKIVLVHDQLSCRWPAEEDQPEDMKHDIFSNIAVTYIEKFAKQCWGSIFKQATQKKEDKVLLNFNVDDLKRTTYLQIFS